MLFNERLGKFTRRYPGQDRTMPIVRESALTLSQDAVRSDALAVNTFEALSDMLVKSLLYPCSWALRYSPPHLYSGSRRTAPLKVCTSVCIFPNASVVYDEL